MPEALCAQSLVTVVTGCILDMQVTKKQGWEDAGCVVMGGVELWVVWVWVYSSCKSESIQ